MDHPYPGKRGEPAGSRHRRDAARTRQSLLEAARARFAREGYAATTVRKVADDAGVNVALINRYFDSKEGLFHACLSTAVAQIRYNTVGSGTERIAAAMTDRIMGTDAEGLRTSLLLLLRSAGDERADRVRRDVLRSITERLAATADASHQSGDEQALLRAQVLLATTLGIVILRTWSDVQPLASADTNDLVGPMSAVVEALLPTDEVP